MEGRKAHRKIKEFSITWYFLRKVLPEMGHLCQVVNPRDQQSSQWKPAPLQADVPLHGVTPIEPSSPEMCLFPSSNSALQRSTERAHGNDGAATTQAAVRGRDQGSGGERGGRLALSLARCCPGLR